MTAMRLQSGTIGCQLGFAVSLDVLFYCPQVTKHDICSFVIGFLNCTTFCKEKQSANMSRSWLNSSQGLYQCQPDNRSYWFVISLCTCSSFSSLYQGSCLILLHIVSKLISSKVWEFYFRPSSSMCSICVIASSINKLQSCLALMLARYSNNWACLLHIIPHFLVQ